MRVRIISHLSLLVVEVLPWTTMCGGAEARCVLCSINVAAPRAPGRSTQRYLALNAFLHCHHPCKIDNLSFQQKWFIIPGGMER